MNTKKQDSNVKKETPNSKLQKSSVIFMQLGLILALLLTYVTLEHKSLIFYATNTAPETPIDYVDAYIDEIDIIKDKPIITKPIKEKPVVIIIKTPTDIIDIKVVKNDSKTEEVNLKPTDETTEVIPVITNKIGITKPKKEETVHINFVQEVPTFFGCKGTNVEKKKCFNKKMNQHIQRNFNIDLVQDLGLSEGKKRISVQFIIDEKGNVVEVIARAPHTRLEEEAKRIINKLPKMIPGKQNKSYVRVKYSLPINFNVGD